MSESTDDQNLILLFAQLAKMLSAEIAHAVRYYAAGTRDLREIKLQLAEPLDVIKKEYTACGYWRDGEAWDWAIRKRGGDEIQITARHKPGKTASTQFIFSVTLPSIH